MPTITFPHSVPHFCASSLTLSCPATVDGTPSQYAITAEALESHFGARSASREDLLRAFADHRQHIESLAERLFELTRSRDIVLRSGHVRFTTLAS